MLFRRRGLERRRGRGEGGSAHGWILIASAPPTPDPKRRFTSLRGSDECTSMKGGRFSRLEAAAPAQQPGHQVARVQRNMGRKIRHLRRVGDEVVGQLVAGARERRLAAQQLVQEYAHAPPVGAAESHGEAVWQTLALA